MTPQQLARALAGASVALGYSLRKMQDVTARGVAHADAGACVEYGALSQRIAIAHMLNDAPDIETARARLATDLQGFARQVME